jgi:PAS domain S-box-containing protein
VQKLKDSELRYRRLFEAAQDGILILDASTGMIKDVNPYLIKMLGYSRTELVKKELWAVGAFKDIEASKEAFEALQTNEYIRYENLPLKAKDGRLIQVEFVSNVYLVGDEKVIQCNIRDITRHRQIEDAHLESDARFRRLVEHLPAVIYTNAMGAASTPLYISPHIKILLGYTPEEWLADPGLWSKTVHSEDRQRVLTQAAKAKQNNKPFDMEYRMVARDGHLVWVHDQFILVDDLEGQSSFWQGILLDITGRKQLDEKLLSAQEFSQSVQDALSAHISILDQESNLVQVNSAWRDFGVQNGLKHSNHCLGMNYLKICDSVTGQGAEGASLVAQAIREISANGKDEITVEYPCHAPNKERWFIARITSFDINGKKWIVVAHENITERKQGEEALRASETKFRSYTESAPLGVFIVDQLGRYVEVNPAASEMLGYTESELLQLSIPDVLAPQALEAGMHQFQRVVEDGSATAEFLFRRKNGVQFWATVLAVRLSEDRFISYCQDITERKLAEETLRLSEEKHRTLVDEVNDGFYESDSAGILTFANPAMARIYGFESPKALVGRAFSDFLAPEIPMGLGAAYGSAVQTENAAKVIKGQIIRPDGTRASIEIKPVMIIKADQIVGTRGVVRDVSERKLSDDKIQQQLEHLIALSEIERAIISSFDLRFSLSTLLTQVIAQLGVDAADVMLFNPVSQILDFSMGRGFRTQAFELGHPLHLGEGYAGRVALERTVVHVSDLAARNDNPRLARALKGEAFIDYYGVPLIAKGKVKGVLEIFHRTPLEPDRDWLYFLNTLADHAAIAIDNFTLFDDLQRSNSELMMAYDATIEGWSRALDLRDKETEGHTQRVTEMTVKLARAFDLSETELVQVRWGALLHDIGKMGVPDGILLKTGPLTDEEWVKMKKHPDFAYQMLAPIRYLRLALDIPYCHHEKWDGSGYPRGLKDDQIPLVARIFAVVDVWDALSSDRPYRAAWTEEKVREHVKAGSGSHFDPKVVEVFFRLME